MELIKIETGNFMADGGAVFGVVPKVMWVKQYPCNNDNYCNLSMRCLLVKTGDRIVLIDTGAGDKQSEKFFSYQHLNGDDSLCKSFDDAGVSLDQVTDVVLTHLHFDHCGGVVSKDQDGVLSLAFPNATCWVAESQWENFHQPNVREGSVYFKENIVPVLESGKLKLVKEDMELCPGIKLRLFNGHTLGQIIPFISNNGKTIVYMADFIPLKASIPEAWVSAYDTNPMVSMSEKRMFLQEACENDYIMFFEHDLYNECCCLEMNDKGIVAGESFKLRELTSIFATTTQRP